MNKNLNETADAVNECKKCLLVVHLLYAAAATVADLLNQPQLRDQHSQGSW